MMGVKPQACSMLRSMLSITLTCLTKVKSVSENMSNFSPTGNGHYLLSQYKWYTMRKNDTCTPYTALSRTFWSINKKNRNRLCCH